MDITSQNFWANVGNIIFLMGRCDYIAIDLEMTGITTAKPATRSFTTFAEVYECARQAASTFQVVQLGFTFVCFDVNVPEDEIPPHYCRYKTFTVTIPISSMFATDDEISARLTDVTNRQLSMSHASVLMLERNGFDPKSTFGNGVSYLSREELDLIESDMLQERQYEDINVEALGEEVVEFYRQLKIDIAKWQSKSAREGMEGKQLSQFNMKVFDPLGTGVLRKTTVKLVHQAVREMSHDASLLRCARDRTDSAMTIRFTTKQEREKTASTRKETKQRVKEQTGVAWIVEAMLGPEGRSGEMLKDDFFPISYPDGELLEAFGLSSRESWADLLRKAQCNKSVLIGHNILHDLCFLHTMVIGKLPETVEELRSCIHRLFPRLIDTKIMAAETTHPDAVDESLNDLSKLFQLQCWPRTRSIPEWSYNMHNSRLAWSDRQRAHDAGFDSYMTATLFLKASFRQIDLQLRSFDLGDPELFKRWLQDPARQDPSLFLKPAVVKLPPRLPPFDSIFFKAVANKLRMSTVGILDLNPTSGAEAT